MELEAKHILTAPNVACPNCGSKLFAEAVVLKKLSPIISPTGKEELYPIPVYACVKCQTVPDEYTSKHNAKHILGEDSNEQDEEPKKSSIIMP